MCERRANDPWLKQAFESGALPRATLFHCGEAARGEETQSIREPDFPSNEDRLVAVTSQEVRAFSDQHVDETFTYFAFDCTPDSGEVLLCLDTLENSVAKAKEHEARIAEQRRGLSYDDPIRLRWAISLTRKTVAGPLLPFNNCTGDFRYQGFASASFPEWEDYWSHDEYPGEYEDSGADCLECKVAVLLSRAIDRLVEQGAFDHLTRSCPFYVGFTFHKGPQIVVRILNW